MSAPHIARPMSNADDPVEVFSLAEFLSDEIMARGWTTADVAIRMKSKRGFADDLMIVDLILCVHNDNIMIGDDTFEDLGRAFGVSAEFLRNLDAIWKKYPDRRSSFTPSEALFGPTSRRALIRIVK